MRRRALAPIPPADPYDLVRRWHRAAAALWELAERRHLAARHPWVAWTTCQNPTCVTAFNEIVAGPFGLDAREPEPERVAVDPVDLAAFAALQQEAAHQEWTEARITRALQRRPPVMGGSGSRFL